jgi:hypothetical protein
MQGRFCRVEPLDPARHASKLFEEFAKADDSSWTYLPDYMGPHKSEAALGDWLELAAASEDPLWNAPSRAAALRLGFQYEGTFRQHMVYRGRSRDTDWFSITDGEWKTLAPGFERWLSPENFDADGRQKQSLVQARAAPR